MNEELKTTPDQGAILDALKASLETDPDLAGWKPGVPETALDINAVMYTALSKFMGEKTIAAMFVGTVLGLTQDGEAVILRFPSGLIWEIRSAPVMAAAFYGTEIVTEDGLRPFDDLNATGGS